MVFTAARPSTSGMSYTKRVSTAGANIISGGMSTSIVGTPSRTGTIATTTNGAKSVETIDPSSRRVSIVDAAGRTARQAAAGAFYCFPVWMWHWASPADPRVPWDRALRIPLPPRTAARKRTAIRRFASQTDDRGHGLGPVLPPGVIAHFTRTMEVLLP